MIKSFVAMAVLAWGLVNPVASQENPKLPVYGRVVPFHLVERSGKSFGDANLKGKIWIADFINCKRWSKLFWGKA